MSDLPQPTTPDEKATLARGRRLLLLAGAILILGVVLAVGRNIIEARALASEARARSVPTVASAIAQPAEGTSSVELTGSVSAFNEAQVLARTTGYVRAWHADLGQKVAAGTVLVDLDAPDLDQELAQARAALVQTRATAELARKAAVRWQELRKSDAVSQQEADDRVAAAAEQSAAVTAAEANLGRLQELTKFKKVTAPYAGVITKRNVEIGQLVSAGAGLPLYVLQQLDPVRVFVSVAQADVSRIHPGSTADVLIGDHPDAPLKGTVARLAGGLDPASRTRQAEIDVPNHDGKLLPGTFVRVKLAGVSAARGVLVPNTALLYRAEGPRMAVIGSDGKVNLRVVTLGDDNGKEVAVLSGIAAGESVVSNPPDALADGDVVKVAKQ